MRDACRFVRAESPTNGGLANRSKKNFDISNVAIMLPVMIAKKTAK